MTKFCAGITSCSELPAPASIKLLQSFRFFASNLHGVQQHASISNYVHTEEPACHVSSMPCPSIHPLARPFSNVMACTGIPYLTGEAGTSIRNYSSSSNMRSRSQQFSWQPWHMEGVPSKGDSQIPREASGTSCSSSSSSRGNNQEFFTRQPMLAERAPSKGAKPHSSSTHLSLGKCLQQANVARTPLQAHGALYCLGRCIQQGGKERRRYTAQEREATIQAASMLTARLLDVQASTPTLSGSSSSSSSSQAAPTHHLDGKQLSLSLWAFSQLLGLDSGLKSRQLEQLVDVVAERVVSSSVINEHAGDACMHWSRILYAIAKMGLQCRDSQAVQQLFDAYAKLFPQMLHRRQQCVPQSLSNVLWAFATAAYPGSMRQLTSAAACNMQWLMVDAMPQEWSNTLWALATLQSRGVELEQSSISSIAAAGEAAMVQLVGRHNSQDASNTLWALATLSYHPNASNIGKLADAMAECSSKAKPQELANTLWALAVLSLDVKFSTISKLATALAESSREARAQELANTLWALATLDMNPGTNTLNKFVTSLAQKSNEAKPQEVSNTLWALATLKMNPGTSTLNKLAIALADKSSEAKPQELANTLWALATLNMNPGTITLNKFARALAGKSNDAQPQGLSNAIWALGQLDHFQANAIRVLATTMAQHENISAAKPQETSNALQGLGSLRWYDATIFSRVVSGLVQKICSSAPEAAGQNFSNAILSCALSSHFDSSVDALAAWASQQDLHLWTEQAISTTMLAWAILLAVADGDTANMRTLAQALFREASRRGASNFTVPNDLGKLHSAHMEAQHSSLPGGGLTDAELQQVAAKHTAAKQQGIRVELGHVTKTVAAALQGSYEVQPAMVQGYHTLLVAHPSCPRGVAIAVTQRGRDYLRYPAERLYGKAALRLMHIGRGCDGLVLCDASELKGSVEQQRSMLLQRLNVAVQTKQEH